jgi:hypothetical protein
MKIKRRSFMKTSLVAGTAIAVPGLLAEMAPSAAAQTAPLPWEREIPLKEAAKSVNIESTLIATGPMGNSGGLFGSGGMSVNNLKMRTMMWGPPERITVSMNKNNVWDRRLHLFKAPTIEEITEGAFAPVNADYVGFLGNSLRPKDLGWLTKEGGSHDPYREPIRYAFPCLKPVGQIILGIDALAGAAAPTLSQNCASGVVSFKVQKGDAKAELEYVLGMVSDTYAIRGNFTGIDTPVWLRLYRHRDTTHLTYMADDNKTYTNPAAEADKAFNGPIDPPTSGQDGKYFWIRQRMPAEKTFPQGFEYLLMGVVRTPNGAKLESVEGKTGLGTPPPNQPLNREWNGAQRPPIAAAPGAAATATLMPGSNGKLEALVTIVTSMDGPDLPAVAKKRLAQAEGFDGVVRENTSWWNAFYDKRESGRVFRGTTGTECTDDIREIYRGYSDSHGGGTKTDMRKYECSASYALPERDFQEWDSAPCYNEIFTTSHFVRNWGDSQDMWKQIVTHWLPGGRENARAMFHLPGMLIVHGYLPPVKPDTYVHTTITLELCLGTMGQIVRPVWDEWDYGGDLKYLREECYPLMKEMALFYAGDAKMGDDGYRHVIPSMQEESWGICPKFSHNKDITSSLCMFRWGLLRAADAAELLGVDEDLRKHWRAVAAQILPNPTWKRPEGVVFAEMPGVEPIRKPDDHFGDAASYPAILADEITLDSPQELKDTMIRSVRMLPSGNTAQTLLVLGVPPDAPTNGARPSRTNGDAEYLLNSRGGRIHLFPVAAPSLTEVAFRNFQARGGFLISACRNTEGVYHLEIEARRDLPCQLMHPWPGKSVVIHEAGKAERVPVKVDTSNGECLIFSARAGHKYVVTRSV